MSEQLIRLAVYGTLMKGVRKEHLGVDALNRQPCVLCGTLNDTGWGFPAFVPGKNGNEVQAELLTVTESTLTRKDCLDGYPFHYRRERVTAAYGDEKTEALVYVMNRIPEDANVIGGGDWRKRS